MKQEFMIKDPKDGSEVFFFAHSFKSAGEYAAEYLRRNSDIPGLELYRVNETPFGPRWIRLNGLVWTLRPN